jgi:hypothetical protein
MWGIVAVSFVTCLIVGTTAFIGFGGIDSLYQMISIPWTTFIMPLLTGGNPMSSEPLISIIDPIRTALGLDSGLVIFLLISAIPPIWFVVYWTTGRTLVAMIGSTLALGFLAIIGVIPVWILFIVALPAAFLVVSHGIIFGDLGGGTKTVKITVYRNSKKVVLKLEQESRALTHYHNNLDELLDIRTFMSELNTKPLTLTGTSIYISKDFDWYIAEKHPSLNIFKVVGLHRKDMYQNVAYVLGRVENQKPFLYSIPVEYTEKSYCPDLLLPPLLPGTGQLIGKSKEILMDIKDNAIIDADYWG